MSKILSLQITFRAVNKSNQIINEDYYTKLYPWFNILNIHD